MVKKWRKQENRRLSIKFASKTHKKLKESRDMRNLPPPPRGTSFSHIGNKEKRALMTDLMRQGNKAEKSKKRRDRFEAEALGEKVERKDPRTVENTREPDETIVPPDDSEVEDDEALDEFMKYFSGETTPKIIVTTQKRPSGRMFNFLKELVHVIPNTFYYPRKEFPFKKMCEYAANKGFTDIMLFHERLKIIQGVYISHLPKGPTSYWRLTKLKLGQEMKLGATCNASHNPELILNNFITRLGRRMSRQLVALFPQKPDFQGRRTVTFHNQRDFIFFRHYRYAFKNEGKGCKLQEIGPRFTLKLRYMQHGTFDSKKGEYEYIWRPDSQVCRKVFAV